MKKYFIIYFELLSITFIYLKLANYISWNWLVVLSPLYAPFILYGLYLIVCLFIGFIQEKENKHKSIREGIKAAEKRKADWRTDTPERNRLLFFRSNKVWHFGSYSYENKKFERLLDKTLHDADVWYYR